MCGIAGFYRNQKGITFDCQAVVSKMSECLKVSRSPWARQWARFVIEEF